MYSLPWMGRVRMDGVNVFPPLDGEVQTQIKTVPLSCGIHLVGEGARRAGEVIEWGE